MVTRTGMAATGHYHCHRRKDGWADWGAMLFDMQYMGSSVIVHDGHVLSHHIYTTSKGDVKKYLISGSMFQMPRMLRVPLYTVYKFG